MFYLDPIMSLLTKLESLFSIGVHMLLPPLMILWITASYDINDRTCIFQSLVFFYIMRFSISAVGDILFLLISLQLSITKSK